jgi:hypothetical protein
MYLLVRYSDETKGTWKQSQVIPYSGDPEVELKHGQSLIDDLWEWGLARRMPYMLVSLCSELSYKGQTTHGPGPDKIDVEPKNVKPYLSRAGGENVDLGIRGVVTTDLTTVPATIYTVRLVRRDALPTPS